jgi:hypothetical protein
VVGHEVIEPPTVAFPISVVNQEIEHRCEGVDLQSFACLTSCRKRRADWQQSSLKSRHTIGPRFLAGPHEKEPSRRRSFDG